MTRTVNIDYMARVEGEASLVLEIEGDQLKNAILDIYEPPRFFQGFLVGRKYDEVPDIVARICGICPAAHELTAIAALEDAMGIQVSQQVRDLRRLLALAQDIQSHALHIYMLALPDYLGYESAIAMAADHKEAVQRALRLKKLGNDFTALIGGRAVHPVTAVVGGFTRIPTREQMAGMSHRLAIAMEDVEATVELVASLKLPTYTPVEPEHVSLRHPIDYPVNEGRLASTRGLDISPREYRNFITEKHVPPSHALHSQVVGRGSFLTGPLARLNLNTDRLSNRAKLALKKIGRRFPDYNPFASICARAVELVQFVEDSILLIDRYEGRPEPVIHQVRAGSGAAFTEAPRGTLYHSYKVDAMGIVEAADIVSPTAHNAANMEKDLRAFAAGLVHLPEEELRLKCEMMIRNYDPCFSCSAHFLKLDVRRS
ncbi:MAG TPA: Ni/Fe hydrogenase subunit alpha [Symbiobacteriaceae bacterium]|nr:Ni/Fe hydrogenase subunit alpha [Symbiobacteriaceae bacterium]